MNHSESRPSTRFHRPRARRTALVWGLVAALVSPGCVVYNDRGEIDHDATRSMNASVQEGFKTTGLAILGVLGAGLLMSQSSEADGNGYVPQPARPPEYQPVPQPAPKPPAKPAVKKTKLP